MPWCVFAGLTTASGKCALFRAGVAIEIGYRKGIISPVLDSDTDGDAKKPLRRQKGLSQRGSMIYWQTWAPCGVVKFIGVGIAIAIGIEGGRGGSDSDTDGDRAPPAAPEFR